mmetsp:Transcript_21312/g.27523  ORF Transcript_21312/g.27523 Transcript_21312/m.27523 type:complete len:378 (-) Transcript_21312:142-1275(-)|eukprot:CAMPEP_0198147918 /NCGR_PEP_ID=MMETSP1443-20131203/38542_1 /TAXON_ID=186043 /ORGANISM="Entomoneis sp., Strain CCMP2396" /LENGTH=377 /DNA_ID=CAMNT_0043812439 /DNA_START=54 /DNA_END=1187 /DNA_ORIENTATION=+
MIKDNSKKYLLLLAPVLCIAHLLVSLNMPSLVYYTETKTKTLHFSDEPADYVAAKVEAYVMKNVDALGYDTIDPETSSGCEIFTDRNKSEIYDDLHRYLKDLVGYNNLVRSFKSPIPDIRKELTGFADRDREVCNTLELHPDGMKGVFKNSELSLSVTTGYLEPLLPPMRHPLICIEGFGKHLMNMDYLVHDFAAICRNLRPTSRTVLIDMGASLDFHKKEENQVQPAIYLTEIFQKFGMPFDHIYAFEITPKEPQQVYELLPDKLQAAYHWINVAVDPTEGAKMNPLTLVLKNFNKDDLIVVKLDVDTPSVEFPLAYQLLTNDRFSKLVDLFYFEHHVHLKELSGSWGRSMDGSVKDSLDMFYNIRKKGIAAHFWP